MQKRAHLESSERVGDLRTAALACVCCGSCCDLLVHRGARLFCAECLVRATPYVVNDPYDVLGEGD